MLGRSRSLGRAPKAVLIDMDDTVFDHTLTCRAAIARVRHTRSELRSVRLHDLWDLYSRSLEATHKDVVRGRLTGVEAREARWAGILARFGGKASRAEVTELSDRYRREYLRLQRPVPGALDLLRRWHARAAVAIVTNNEVAEQERKLEFLGARRWVDHLVVSQEIGVGKPDPGIFREALRRVGARAADSVMIGDSWASDVLGAVGAGIRPIWFNRFHHPQPAGPAVAQVDSFRPARRVDSLISGPSRPGTAPARIITRETVQRR